MPGDVPVRVEVWDDDPASPTYRYGPFGEVPRFYTSSLVTTEAQATAAGEAILRRATGLVEGVSWTSLVDPAVDVGDIVAVVNPAVRVNRVMVLDSVTVPLGPAEAMSAVARTVRTTGEEAEADG